MQSPPVPPAVRHFFAVYRAEPDLHAFPTRRSSDLRYDDPRVQRELHGEHKALRWSESLHLDKIAGLYALQDRKSTRLNSSHLGISYAVFCLKKKNEVRNLQHATHESRRAAPDRRYM